MYRKKKFDTVPVYSLFFLPDKSQYLKYRKTIFRNKEMDLSRELSLKTPCGVKWVKISASSGELILC